MRIAHGDFDDEFAGLGFGARRGAWRVLARFSELEADSQREGGSVEVVAAVLELALLDPTHIAADEQRLPRDPVDADPDMGSRKKAPVSKSLPLRPTMGAT